MTSTATTASSGSTGISRACTSPALIAPQRRASTSAQNSGITTFSSSAGWKTSGSTPSQRRAPRTLQPDPGDHDDHGQQQCDDRDRGDHAPPRAVVPQRDRDGQRDAQQTPQQLTAEDAEGVAVPRRLHERRRERHQQAQQDQHDDSGGQHAEQRRRLAGCGRRSTFARTRRQRPTSLRPERAASGSCPPPVDGHRVRAGRCVGGHQMAEPVAPRGVVCRTGPSMHRRGRAGHDVAGAGAGSRASRHGGSRGRRPRPSRHRTDSRASVGELGTRLDRSSAPPWTCPPTVGGQGCERHALGQSAGDPHRSTGTSAAPLPPPRGLVAFESSTQRTPSRSATGSPSRLQAVPDHARRCQRRSHRGRARHAERDHRGGDRGGRVRHVVPPTACRARRRAIDRRRLVAV